MSLVLIFRGEFHDVHDNRCAAVTFFPTSEQLRHVLRGVLTHCAHYKHLSTPHGDLLTVLLQETLVKMSFGTPGMSAKVSSADLTRNKYLFFP